MSNNPTLSPNEPLKEKSRGLRGTLTEGLQDQITGAISAGDQQLIKFHGIYQQDDRDRRHIREQKKLEWDFSFMVRLRLPGGDISSDQWLGIARICDTAATGVVKITTRQTVQIHGVVKAALKPTVQWFQELGIDTIAACGDVNRNVISGANPSFSKFHDEVHAFATKISEHLKPKTGAFSEIWLDGEKLTGDEPEEDPLYQKRYLPRKFKIALAIPPHNDTDVFAHDIGLIAIEEKGKFIGFNVSVGGGMGTTHGNAETYPRLGTVIGYVAKEKVLDTCWQIVAVQRDFGNRSDRKLARLKYTFDRMGEDAFRSEVEARLGYRLEKAKPYLFSARADIYGWNEDHHGKQFCTVRVENGRVVDHEGYAIKTALKEIAETKLCAFRFTTNQNIMLVNVEKKDRAALEAILKKHGIAHEKFSPIHKDALACVALNTCPLALAEAQRYMPALIGKLEKLLAKHKLEKDPFSIRMTGCPNGCARPHVAEIALVGRSLGHYNLHLAGDALGERMNRVYRENINEEEILKTLDQLFARYAKERHKGERFGDYVQRTVTFNNEAA
jgi:sulfite reductase (NADPH) hemoprotein beta-component